MIQVFVSFFLIVVVFVYRMAPKEQKRKPAMKKTNKSEAKIMSEPRHNIVTYLDPQDKLDEFKEITRFLRES
ncbi:hypothetical protein Hanom_Chr07g00601771 [Helianthus anomalus]